MAPGTISVLDQVWFAGISLVPTGPVVAASRAHDVSNGALPRDRSLGARVLIS